MSKGFEFHWFLKEHKTEDESKESSGNTFGQTTDLSKMDGETATSQAKSGDHTLSPTAAPLEATITH